MDHYGIGYDNIPDAIAGADDALGRQPGVRASEGKDAAEYTTVIYRDPTDGKLYRTRFATSGSAGQAPVGQLFTEMRDANLAPLAVLHNHPGGKNAAFNPQYLSAADTALGKGEQKGQTTGPVQMFLHANDQMLQGTGRMETTTALDPQTHQRVYQHFQTTEPFLAQIPIQEIVQRIDQRNAFTRAAAAIRNAGKNPIQLAANVTGQ